MSSIPGVGAACRALPDARWGPPAACFSRHGLRGGAGRVAASPPAAQLPPVLPLASGGAFHPPRHPRRPVLDTLRQALVTERELFVSPQRPKR